MIGQAEQECSVVPDWSAIKRAKVRIAFLEKGDTYSDRKRPGLSETQTDPMSRGAKSTYRTILTRPWVTLVDAHSCSIWPS